VKGAVVARYPNFLQQSATGSGMLRRRIRGSHQISGFELDARKRRKFTGMACVGEYPSSEHAWGTAFLPHQKTGFPVLRGSRMYMIAGITGLREA